MITTAKTIDTALKDQHFVEEQLEDYFDDDDFIPDSYRESRFEQMKTEMKKYELLKGKEYGQYTDIETGKELLEITVKEKRVVCHFYHNSMPRCKIIDRHLQIISEKYCETKFIKFDVTKSTFLATKLHLKILPAVLTFVDGINTHRTLGFEDLGKKDDFKTSQFISLLASFGVLGQEKPSIVKSIVKSSMNYDDFED